MKKSEPEKLVCLACYGTGKKHVNSLWCDPQRVPDERGGICLNCMGAGWKNAET